MKYLRLLFFHLFLFLININVLPQNEESFRRQKVIGGSLFPELNKSLSEKRVVESSGCIIFAFKEKSFKFFKSQKDPFA